MVIKLLLWNVNLTPDFSILNPFRNSKERYPKIAEIINQFDIVVLNECFLYRKELMELANHAYQYTDTKPWYKFFNSGVVILSKFPFNRSMYRHFSSNSYWDRIISKGILKVSFQIGPKLFDLYGTHMQQYNNMTAHEVRLRQVNEIIRFVGETRTIGADIILVGDLNMGPVSDISYKSYPVHYSSTEDARLRNEQYEALIRGLNLTNYVKDDDICHLLYNGRTLKPERIDVPDYKLSDTGAYCLEFKIRQFKKNEFSYK